jgi:glycosyltransferase involved in cell wall biosynthesis
LRLLVALPTYHPFYSGAAERFRRYLPGFRARGIDVTVFTGTPDETRKTGAALGDAWSTVAIGGRLPPDEIDGIPVHRVRLPGRRGFRRDMWFARSLRAFCRDPGRVDVVQMFSAPAAGLHELWRLRRAGIPVVATRTMIPSLPRNLLKRTARKALIRVPSSFVACEVVGSQAMLDAFRSAGIRRRLEVVPHGVDTDRFRPAREEAERGVLRRQLDLPVDATVLLFAGSLKPRKGVHLLVEAWSRLAPIRLDLHLVLLGPRPANAEAVQDSYCKSLERRAELSGARDRLHLRGVVSNVEEYMRTADLFVFPSSREGMPNVLGEAMASGLPVLTTPFTGLSRELGQPGTHYVLSGFESERIAGDIVSLLDSPRHLSDLGRSGRLWVEQHLNVGNSIDRYVELYRELATEKGRSC